MFSIQHDRKQSAIKIAQNKVFTQDKNKQLPMLTIMQASSDLKIR